ncbi:beta-N-acetylhexosaminidase [Portibacter lacus]|uniref:beta-N-acetylhexosaminidase n=2 Tax=Portibacter lacus TaxID=1099794 RepID=A0AA37WDX0_9BACT|nr:beta-N-acetylhexosaminidase [Portibacter lacus]
MVIAILFSCEEQVNIDLNQEDFLPKPRSIVNADGTFEITASTPINLLGDEAKVGPIADFFNERINKSTGFELTKRQISGASSGINLYLIDEGEEFSEAYRVEITKNNVIVSSANEAGLFYGVQTLLQMLPPEIHADSKQDIKWQVSTGSVRDRPAYGYRGTMLDVARHFFSVDDVKRVIDHIASYKMNRLHLHLSDDQGWRIEIKAWPNLTKIGGTTQVGGGKGGFYTQEQYKDIVAYAAKQFVTIVPEIDMPGHTNAALASYAELNCDGKATDLYTGTEVGFSTLCVDKEITYKFIDDVIRELAEMTPGEYIHIGGDESHVTPIEDYIPFMERVQGIVSKHNKKSMAWDEIAHAKLKENTIVQFWAEEENAKKGVMQGAKVLMSPAKRAYIDMQYDSTTRIGLHWAAYIEADSAYTWNLEEYVKGVNPDQIIGIEAPMWTETITNMDDIEYMMFPRLTALAEIGWTETANRSWDDYKERLARHSEVWNVKGINYYKSPRIDWEQKKIEE